MRGGFLTTVVVVWAAACGYYPAVATIRVGAAFPFCNLATPLLHCSFTNTSEDVEVSGVEAGVTQVRIESATSLHASIECMTALQVWSSINVTLLGGGTHNATLTTAVTTDISVPGQEDSGAGYHPIVFPKISHKKTPLGSFERNESIVTAGYNKNYSKGEEQEDCNRNVSVTQSKLLLFQGHFEMVSFQLSQVEEMRAEVHMLDMRNTLVSRMTIKATEARLKNIKVTLLTQLEVTEYLSLWEVKIKRASRPGFISKGSSGQGNFTLNKVSVDLMEAGTVWVSGGEMSISNMIVGIIHEAAITVEAGGKLTLNNVLVLQGTYSCLVLNHGATLVLNNFTLGNETIRYLELSTSGSQNNVKPLLALAPQPVMDSAQSTFLGFSWYWIIIMTVVGLIAGIVVGSAIMWRRPDFTLPSVISLAELLGREQRQPEQLEGHTNEVLHSSKLNRKDSGLSSSSFASFTPCQERLSSLPSHSPTDKLPHILPTAIPNIYEETKPHTPGHGDAIYEEMEVLTVLKTDNTYLPMSRNS